MIFKYLLLFVLITLAYWSSTTITSCAVMSPPTGGPRDSIAPKLLKATPATKAINVKSKTITLEFDEYIQTEDEYNKITIQPLPTIQPEIKARLKTLTIKLRDSLLDNTTYSIVINGAVKDVNEGNKLNDYAFTFTTGATIDSNSIAGNVVMAQTGKVDSALIVVLYTNQTDSAVAKERPKYVTKLSGDGSFKFNNLPNTTFALYAYADEGSQKKYTSLAQTFAFSDSLIKTSKNPSNLKLYAYVQQVEKLKPANDRPNNEKWRLSTNINNGQHDVLQNVVIVSNKKISTIDTASIILTDTLYKQKYARTIVVDSSKKTFSIIANWPNGAVYTIIVPAQSLTDDKGKNLAKSDTIRFATKAKKEYGNATIRFNNLNIASNPVLQIMQSDKLIASYTVNTFKLTIPLLSPGEYELALLYDTNKNKVWDAGSFFEKKQQPEKVKLITQKLNVKADWDNEVEITESL
jgi:hypothetical protein